LRDAVAEHQLRAKVVPQPVFLQDGFCRLAVGSDVGIGNRKLPAARKRALARLDQASQAVETWIDGQR
jgi:hypothetical protein